LTRRSRGRIWRIIMILVLILLGVVDLGGVLPPLPNVVVPPDARSRNDDAGANDPRRTTAEARCRCCQVRHAKRTMTRMTTRQPMTMIGSSAIALMAFLACIAPPCRVVRSPPLSLSSIVVVVPPPPPIFRGVKLCVDECY
jgi:hypothetical protein